MHYTIYKLTNTTNGKTYIGKHQTKNLNDGYMGSGKLIKRAVAKHGVESFHKEILFQFDNEADMTAKEAELVTEDFCLRQDTYNLCVGGRGGFSYMEREGTIHRYTKDNAKSMSMLGNVARRKQAEEKRKFVHVVCPCCGVTFQQVVKRYQKAFCSRACANKRIHTVDTKRKIAESCKRAKHGRIQSRVSAEGL